MPKKRKPSDGRRSLNRLDSLLADWQRRHESWQRVGRTRAMSGKMNNPDYSAADATSTTYKICILDLKQAIAGTERSKKGLSHGNKL